MIVPELDSRGLPSALCKCDTCDRETHERAKHEGGRKTMTEGQVRLRLQGRGWTYIKGVLRCPSCEDQRKSKMPENAMTEKLKTLTSVEPTREQKRQINALLETVYDTEAQRYLGKESDASVAEALGAAFKIDWVSQVREEFYGPEGDNTEMIEIAAEMAELKAELKKALERDAEAERQLKTLADRIMALSKRLDHFTGVKRK